MIEMAHSIETLKYDDVAKWKFFEALGYTPDHPEVLRFHNSKARCKIVLAPARSGKSYSAAHEQMPSCLVPDTMNWVVGPSYSLAEKEFRYIKQKLVDERDRIGLPKPDVCYHNAASGKLYIRWPMGS